MGTHPARHRWSACVVALLLQACAGDGERERGAGDVEEWQVTATPTLHSEKPKATVAKWILRSRRAAPICAACRW